MNKTIFYKSSYEKKALLMLDNDESVISYEYEPFSIEYFHPNKQINSNYLIDFKITYKDGIKKLVEVKPAKHMITSVVNQEKAKSAQKKADELGYIFEIWTEECLFSSQEDLEEFVEALRESNINK